jgi:hypothetical protein
MAFLGARRWGRIAIGMVAMAALGCGSEERRPDTGVGADQPVPSALNCMDYCRRLSSCLVLLCNEDTKSTSFTGLEDLVTVQCQSVCNENDLRSRGLTDVAWTCLFQSSCREAIDYDVCNGQASYSCT